MLNLQIFQEIYEDWYRRNYMINYFKIPGLIKLMIIKIYDGQLYHRWHIRIAWFLNFFDKNCIYDNLQLCFCVDDAIRCQHTSSPLGNGAIVETSDKKILVLQRSNNVGEFPGHFVFPGGHPEVSSLKHEKFATAFCSSILWYLHCLYTHACMYWCNMYVHTAIFFSLSWGPGLKLFISFFVISNFWRSPLPVPPSFQVYTYMYILWAVAVSSSVHGSHQCILHII